MTPEEIRAHQFAKRPLGYDPGEVRAFLESVTMTLEQIRRRDEDAARKIGGLESQVKDYQALEASLRQALVQAQEAGAAAAEHGRKEAHALIREAETKASVIVERSRSELAAVQEQITILRAKKDSIVARLRMLLQSELDLLKALEVNAGLHDSREAALPASSLAGLPGTSQAGLPQPARTPASSSGRPVAGLSSAADAEINEIVRILDGV